MRYATFALLMLTAAACGRADVAQDTVYGEPPSDEAPVPVEAVLAEPEQFSHRSVALSGRVHEVCRHDGCWLTLQADDGTGNIMVHVARTESGEYEFTVPQDINGRYAVAEGVLSRSDRAQEAHLEADGAESVPEYWLTATSVRVHPAD